MKTTMYLPMRLMMAMFFLALVSFSQAQNIKLTGKVLNEKNEALPSVSVKIVGGGGTTTDVEGRFSLSLVPGKKYEIEFSAVGYETKTINEVEAITGQINELNITLQVKAATGDNVTVSARRSTAPRETVASAISFQKNTNTVASVISAESIRRSPDKNTGEVIKRTPGASLQEGKFIIVRGLADRYNQAMLNGILLTSTEPDRKTFSFDLIPAPMIDNIIINKAFVPEYPGEWAGGLIQVNTKDIPSKNFLNVQVGLGFNTATTGKDFYKETRGKLDWLGIDDGSRALPSAFPTKYNFDTMSIAQKTALGKTMDNRWVSEKTSGSPNASFQANGGFATTLFGKKIGGTFGINYSRTNSFYNNPNQLPIPDATTGKFNNEYEFGDNIYDQAIAAGALGSLSIQLNPLNKISFKSIINVNTINRVLERSGKNITRTDSLVAGTEFTFKQNTFFTGQVSGDHGITKSLKLKWYGAFNILDGYVPDQRRILYSKTNVSDPYRLVISNTLSQQSGSRIYQALSDYIYTGGGDLTYSFGKGQSVKGGYMLQIKDRLFDARLFSFFLPRDNDVLKQLPAGQIFSPQNFGDGSATSTLFAFDAIKGSTFRYMANTILNAGFIQFDNQLAKQKIRIVWGLRVENYDQLVGSVKKWDPRHTYSKVTDFLPGVNATFKINPKTNIRLSGSQTVIRPELRELAALNIYDFELNASVQGNPSLKRTKVTNLDLRYELYPRQSETFSLGVFYKHFEDPIESLFEPGTGGASTFNYQNADKATAFGVEIEFRKKLDMVDAFKNFTVQGNLSYIKSKVEDTALNIDRPLQGQSPYVINIGLLYDLEKKGFNATLLYNQIGQRIANVGKVEDGFPDVWERGRPLLDLQLSQKIMHKKGEIRLNVSDLLNQSRYYYENNAGSSNSYQSADPYRFKRTFGTTFTLTFNYSIL
ncbi:MAG: TonB-dependent receptor [Chitinophagaceae bacterium]|nr:TonB-dependent receptor [Chitinophagaceae bacterium]